MIKKLSLFLFLLLFSYFCLPFSSLAVKENEPLKLFANQCDDDIRQCFISAIRSAKHSIVLFIYSLNDYEIIKAIKEKKKENLKIKIVIDSKNVKDFEELNEVIYPKEKKTGLMHQKILIVDEKKVWIGSANFTATSLRVHDNLVVAFHSQEIAESLKNEKGGAFFVGGQKIEIYWLPKERKEAFARLLVLIEQARQTLNVAMFTWTHPMLSQAVIAAQKRGVGVDIVLDENSSMGASKKSMEKMLLENIDVKVNIGSPLLHHKFAYIDQCTLIMGSTNWTKAAFSKNDECILIIHDLTEKQRKKMDKLWHALRATAKKGSISLSLAEGRWENSSNKRPVKKDTQSQNQIAA